MAAAPRPLIGLLAGVAAGVVAAAAMAAFQAQASKLLDDDGEEDEPAGQSVHYITGAVMGGIYGVLTEYRPEASAGFGGTYGIVTAALLDDGAAPGPAPEADAVPAETPTGVASHLVFGLVLEGVRWLIAGRR